MKDYGRMEIMRLPDEEIERILREEGTTLSEGVAAMMLEELEHRKEDAPPPDLGLTEEELAELNAEADDGEDETQEAEEAGESPEDEEEEGDGGIADMERQIDAQNKENKKILIISSVTALLVAAGAVAVLLILNALGKL